MNESKYKKKAGVTVKLHGAEINTWCQPFKATNSV